MAENKLVYKIFYDTTPGLISTGILLLRCIIGVYLFIAGAGKVLHWFGGYGMPATIQFLAKVGISAPLAYLSSYAEFLGGFLLAIGLFTRPVAFAILINMTVATIVTLHGGLMGPNSAQTPLMFLIIDVAVLLSGPMAYSLDRLIFGRALGIYLPGQLIL
jgi:putative oxidoreductase